MIRSTISSTTGIALRFFWANKAITISSVLTVALSIALVLTLANLFANTQESIQQIREMQSLTEFTNPALSVELAAEYEHAQQNLGPLRTFIIVLSMLTLLASGLLAISNFGILHQKCKTQFAIMRAVGASPSQLVQIGIVQAGFITGLGASIGLILAFAAFRVSHLWFEQAFSFSSLYGVSQFGLNTALIILVLVLSVLFILTLLMIPSIRLARTVAVEIEYDRQQNTFFSERAMLSIILVLMLGGLSFIGLSLLDNVIVADHVTVAGTAVIPDNTFTVLVGAPLLISALFLMIPFIAPPLLERTLPLLKRLIGNTSFVAIKNLIPQIQKSALMILLLSAVVMSAVFGSTFLETVRRGEHYRLAEHFPTEFILIGPQLEPSMVNPAELKRDLMDSPQVEHVSVVSSNLRSGAGPFTLGPERGDGIILHEVIVTDIMDMYQQGLFPEGVFFAPSQTKDSVIISWRMAAFFDLRVGDVFAIKTYAEVAERREMLEDAGEIPQEDDFFEEDVERTLEVVGILRDFPGYGPYFDFVVDAGAEFFHENPAYISVDTVYISAADNQEVLTHLSEVMQRYPDLTITRLGTAIDAADQTFFQMWSIVIVVTAILLICSTVGVFNTLMAHINRKRKEFAILRAVSVSENGIVQIILTQVVLYVLVGLAFGGVLGVLLTYLLIIMDPMQVYFNVALLIATAGALLFLALTVFTCVARKVGKLKPVEELVLD